MLASVDPESSVAVYVQIENHVQFAIAAGQLKAGDQLPSVLELSRRLKVNPNTVAKAYRDLEVMGVVYTRRGVGVYVKKGIESRCREVGRKKVISRLHEAVAEAKAAGMTKTDITEIAERSAALDTGPYSAPPQSLLAYTRNSRNRISK
ncbi:MAG: GntR family transcriptional regulator [Candidatus Hydrogenedentes bacterium]|nr:GntR family transcriptional regulator [Candidatus Hydrogenedentota bacterium]